MVLGRDSRKKWSRWDFALAKAYQRYLDELCPQCGLPFYVCHIADSRIEFKVVKDVCFATAEVERRQAMNSSADKKPEPGVKFVPQPRLVGLAEGEELELSDFRLPYFKEVAIRRGLISPVDSQED